MVARSSDFNELSNLIKTELGDSECQLTLDTRLLDLGGWDSIKTIGLILSIEQHFGVSLVASDVDSMERVGDFVRAIAAQRPLQ